MVDYAALNKAIDDSGMKRNAVAGKLGLTPQSFSHKVNGVTEFKLSEVQSLCEILRINQTQRQNIFFC